MKRTPPEWAPKTKTHQCLKCNKKWELKYTYDRVKQTTLFCNSCAQTAVNLGYSLIDEYLSKELHYYQPKGPYILKCECGSEQTYTTKYSLVRVLQTTGKCGDCSKTMNRDWSNITQEYRDWCTLHGYNIAYKTSFDTLDEFNTWYKDNVDNTKKRNYQTYCKQISEKSRKNLKLHNPQEYERWSNYKWNGTDMNQLTIDHHKEMWECYRDNWTVAQASHISNLVVMSMRENIEKHISKKLNGSDPKLLKSQKEETPQHHNFW